MAEHNRKYTTEQVAEAFARNSGNVAATARELGLVRSTVQKALRKTNLNKKPLVGGDKKGFSDTIKAKLPAKGLIKRYICTSAQNNTHVNKPFWNALLKLADHYDAEVLVGTFSYNTNAYSAHPAKRGTGKLIEELWYDPCLTEYISDKSMELANGLVWCGEMNILPTAVNPLAGLETYTHRKSAIFPHAKVAMRSIATMQGEGTKLNYTTGTVTLKNYIQKKEGIKAEHHHRFGALVVEVNHVGAWWVRQVGWSSKSDVLQDLDVVVRDGKVTEGNTVEAITWGDLHATHAEEWVVDCSQHMLDTLKPRFQFLHDILEGVSINRHVIKHAPDPHYAYNRWLRGFHRVDAELSKSVEVVKRYQRPWCEMIVPDSNHDGWWLKSWLAKYDYRYDPANAELFLDMQKWMYAEIKRLTPEGLSHKDVNLTQYVMEKFGLTGVKFLLADESFTICGKKIECGMHGHLGANGKPGSPDGLSIIGRRANTGHTHSAGIWNGLYVAGTTSKLKWSYTYGPSSWSHSHIVTYPNGMRTIVTMWAGRWRA